MRIRLFGITINVSKSHYAKKPVVVTDTPCKRAYRKKFTRQDVDLINSGLAPRKIAELTGHPVESVYAKKWRMSRARAAAQANLNKMKEDLCK